jgi:hypothetical protein
VPIFTRSPRRGLLGNPYSAGRILIQSDRRRAKYTLDGEIPLSTGSEALRRSYSAAGGHEERARLLATPTLAPPILVCLSQVAVRETGC